MTKTYPEKRRHTRVFFGEDYTVGGLISTASELDSSFSVTILNISEGGLQFNQKRIQYKGAQPGDKLLLRRINGLHELVSLVDIPMQIIWVMDNEYLDHVIVGVAFTNLTNPQRKTLQDFVKTCLALNMDKKELK